MDINNFLMQMTAWHWLGLGVLFLVLELLTGGGFLLWTSISAAVVGIFLFFMPTLNWTYQWLMFGVFTISSAIAWWIYLQKKPIHTDKPALNRRSEQYVGNVYTLKEPLINGRGRLHISDTEWPVSAHEDLAAGTKVKVYDVDGIVLKVKKVNE